MPIGPRRLCLLLLQYEPQDLSLRLLRSLVQHESGNLAQYRVVLIDNGSRDPQFEQIAREFPFVELVRHASNEGYAKVHNRIWESIREPWTLLLNNDCLLLNDAIQCTLNAAGAERADYATCALFNPDLSPQVNFAPVATPLRRLGLNCTGFNRLVLERIRLRSQRCRVGFVNGAFFLIRTQLFRDVGGFDERFFMYGEDLDLILRLSKVGARGFRFSAGEVLHTGGGTVLRFWSRERQIRTQIECYSRVLRMHYPFWQRVVFDPLDRLRLAHRVRRIQVEERQA